MKIFDKKGLTRKSDNISDWYHDVVLRAGLAEYSDVKGCMIIKPRGFALWEKTQAALDAWFKEDGVQNCYFPIFIPMDLFQKEKEHVEGFSPELAVVTHAGGEELAEPLAIRPTSETVITQKLADWIQSYRDLPLKLNQWCNIVRWEKRTYPFLRTSEFLWQEGHTVHADKADAIGMVMTALEWYARFYREHFAIAPYVGLKSQSEKFAGADETYSIEIVVPDGKALQSATSHYLGENFTKVFDVGYLDEKGNRKLAHQTSWGLSTRAIGGLVFVHGDNSGLVLPPAVAPEQVVIIGVGKDSEGTDEKISTYVGHIHKILKDAGVRVVSDLDFRKTLGYRINDWELKGVPLRIEVGAKELAARTTTLVRRDNFEKHQMNVDLLNLEIPSLLEMIQKDMLKKSETERNRLTTDVVTWEEFKKITAGNKMFIRAPWCEDAACEAAIKEETKATTRCLELDRRQEVLSDTPCIHCGKPAIHKWLFAQAY
ncbi:MAG: Proline-tRNA ligase [Candidatus Yanofskybacteria bacterium GW2011_GWA1_48_10]|uniref:Proline--tRNA ligase n=2 Tax=Candidatus Yanofskyibacteriota TaxID=1752733 RepID=A0A0G1U7D8_9BACT|nr:MAG: Proline-tRNA ligase [Candidatus Yanofskybacteria bacterium GW2011_GWA1_48_10]OGN05991.1 MAG: proline--tRNA ligase [Candidatus Yanofskybacteria bacterium RIFCSPHIGHO2_01_FULL_48_25b]